MTLASSSSPRFVYRPATHVASSSLWISVLDQPSRVLEHFICDAKLKSSCHFYPPPAETPMSFERESLSVLASSS